MHSLTKPAIAAVLITSALLAVASAQRPPRYASPEVHQDRSVTFRIWAPQADKVSLWGKLADNELDIDKAESGLWTIQTKPLEPELYEYAFLIDGVYVPDPLNRNVKTARQLRSIVIVPNEPPELFERLQVPHGTVHAHHYFSKTLGAQRRLHVYTPPGYEKSDRHYPVLYLLHGSGDDDAVWLSTGRAGFIADNLLAVGKAEPMIIVMPRGHAKYADPEKDQSDNPRLTNLQAFEADLMKEVIPLVEKTYRVSTDPQHRAISGLSMGGAQTLHIGLNHLNKFHYVCPMSAGVYLKDFAAAFPALAKEPEQANNNITLLWIGCGKNDRLMEVNSRLHTWLEEKGIEHTFVETDHAHSWDCWREYLGFVLPQLFRD